MNTSKHIRPCLIVVLIYTLFFTACTNFLTGKPSKQETLNLKVSDDACAAHFKNQLSRIGTSAASTDEVNQVFNCIDKYMNQFQTKVEGQHNPEIYTAQDFLYITNRFFSDLNLSAETIEKLIKFKQALVGGEVNLITRQEITQLRNYFKIIRTQTIKLLPVFKIFNPEIKIEQLSAAEITTAYGILNESLKATLRESQIIQSRYTYSDIKSLLQSLQILDSTKFEITESIDHIRQLLIGNQVLTDTADYNLFIDNITDATEIYSQARYGFFKFEMKSIESTHAAINSMDKVIQLLSTTVQFKKEGRLSTFDLDGVLKILINKKIIPFELKYETLITFYKVALKRVFNQETSEFITEAQFNYYRKESALFKLELDFLETQVVGRKVKIAGLQKDFKMYMQDQAALKISRNFANKDNALIRNTMQSMMTDLYQPFPLLIKNDKYVISRNQALDDLKAYDLLRSFYIKMWARQLLMGWGDGKMASGFSQAKINRSQMDLFKREFQQIGIELKLTDPRSPVDGKKAFLESNLFGFSSDGNEFMSMFETFEYLHYLVSEGAWNTSQVREDAKINNCQIEELDVFGNHFLNENCFINNLKINYPKYFSSKPELVKYLSGLSAADFLEYYNMMMDVSRTIDGHKNVKIETADIQTFLVLTSYVEAMFVKQDLDQNKRLSAHEIRQSYPKFKSFATGYSLVHAKESLDQWNAFYNYCHLVYSKEDLIRESFIFMVLNKGQMPVLKDMNYITCAVKGIYTFKNEIDRKSIVYTFLVLKSVLASDE